MTSFIDGSSSVGRINCSLVIPINRQMQNDGYFAVALILSKMKETSNNIRIISQLFQIVNDCY